MQTISNLDSRLLVVFDGQCGLCNRSIRWLMRRDRRNRLLFAPSSHPAVAELLARHGVSSTGPDTILVFRDLDTPVEEMLVRSNAILTCLESLPQPWPTLAALARLVPRTLRDVGYRQVARIRYRIWGRYDVCPLPTAEERAHFL